MPHPSKNKIRICHVLSKLDIGGMENGVINLCNNLNSERFEPMICCVKDRGLMAARLNDEVKIYNLRYKEGKAPLRPIALASFFKKIKPDIVHSHGWGSCSLDGIIGARLASAPVVLNGEHGYIFNEKHQVYLQKLLAKMCDQILSVSNTLKIRIQKEFNLDPAKISVIQNGVEINNLRSRSEIQAFRNKLLSELKLDPSDKYFIIGSVGSLKPAKNQMLLLKAIQKIKSDTNILVLLIGDGPDRTKLEKFITEANLNKSVFLMGQQQNVQEFYPLFDVLVSTSISNHEGMSNVILEAMANSVPVIATNSVGSAELIKDEFNGYLIASNNIEALQHRLQFLMVQPEIIKNMGRAAHCFVKKNFSLEKMIAEYQSLYLNSFNRKSVWHFSYCV